MAVSPTEALMHRAQSRPESTAFIFHEDVWTYRRFADEVERAARGLAAWGVKAGDRITLHMMNRPEMLVAYYACFRLGAIAAPLRTAFKYAELAPLLQRLEPTLYVGESSLYRNVAPVDTAILPQTNRFIVNGAAEQADDVQPWDNLLREEAPVDLPMPASHKPAVLINTSGTTGQPKFVTHTPDTLAAMTELLGKHGGFWPDDKMVLPLAMAHISGLICSLTCIDLGIPFIVLESFDADAVLDNVAQYGCTRMIGFPYQYATLLASQQAKPRDLSSLRICLTGGDACPVDLQERVTSVFGAPLYNFWGATEVIGSLTFGLGHGPVVRIVEGAYVRLVDDRGADVADGQIGELLISGPNVFVGYWNDPTTTDQSLKAGWYHTGDLMRRGDGDELWFVSRKKDIIIRGGTNISPVEIEEALVASHPAVEEAAVVGKSDAILGQRVFAFVKLAAGAKTTVIPEILQNVAERLAPYKVPEDLQVISALPRNALSKVDRKMLEAMACADTAQVASTSRTPKKAGARRGKLVALSGSRL
jgi:long-chain acyl-CoA synthetase